MPDFGQYNPQIQEAYLELKTLPLPSSGRANSRNRWTGSLRQDRDLASPSAPWLPTCFPSATLARRSRDRCLSNPLTTKAATFAGSSDGANAVFTQWTRGNEAAGRVFFMPFATTSNSALKNLGFGARRLRRASTRHHCRAQDHAQTISSSTPRVRCRMASTIALAPGLLLRRPFGVIAEYVISSQEVFNKGKTAGSK